MFFTQLIKYPFIKSTIVSKFLQMTSKDKFPAQNLANHFWQIRLSSLYVLCLPLGWVEFFTFPIIKICV